MTIEQAQMDIDNWIKTTGVQYFSELTNLGILMEEVGELSRLKAPKRDNYSSNWARRPAKPEPRRG